MSRAAVTMACSLLPWVWSESVYGQYAASSKWPCIAVVGDCAEGARCWPRRAANAGNSSGMGDRCVADSSEPLLGGELLSVSLISSVAELLADAMVSVRLSRSRAPRAAVGGCSPAVTSTSSVAT